MEPDVAQSPGGRRGAQADLRSLTTLMFQRRGNRTQKRRLRLQGGHIAVQFSLIGVVIDANLFPRQMEVEFN